MERVYEINRNFRNEGISTRHNPEFTMLEFYQAYTDYQGLMDLSAELLRQTAIDATGSTQVDYDGQMIDFGNIRRFTMREAVIEFWRGEQQASARRRDGPRVAGAAFAARRHRESSWSISSSASARITSFQPTIIYDYPVENSPLSKNKPDEPAFVERFEIYAAGMEIGNAYTELNDPQEQRRRFEMQLGMAERATKKRIGWTRTTCAH